jgi:hypothetical protein
MRVGSAKLNWKNLHFSTNAARGIGGVFIVGLIVAVAYCSWKIQGVDSKQGAQSRSADIFAVGNAPLKVDQRFIRSVDYVDPEKKVVSALRLELSANGMLGSDGNREEESTVLVVLGKFQGYDRATRLMELEFTDWLGREQLPPGAMYTRLVGSEQYVRRTYYLDESDLSKPLQSLQALELDDYDRDYFFDLDKGKVSVFIRCMNEETPSSAEFFGIFEECEMHRNYYNRFSYRIIFERSRLRHWVQLSNAVSGFLDVAVQDKNWTTSGSMDDEKWIERYLVERSR